MAGLGWTVARCQGHRRESIKKAFETPHRGPLVIIADTVKGKGVSFMENSALWHGRSPTPEELKLALEELE